VTTFRTPDLPGPRRISARIFNLQITGAEVLARFADGTPPGPSPAITVNRFGKGQAVYVAAVMEQELLNRLIDMFIEPEDGWPVSDSTQVEIVLQQNADYRLCFVLNHGPDEVSVRVPKKAEDLISGHSVSKTMKLGPYNVAVLSWKTSETVNGKGS
jgi:beta-galactosidase